MSEESNTPEGPINRHRLIVLHPSRPGVIAVDRGALPWIDTEDRHTADVEHLIDAVAARYAIRATVLRSVLHGYVVAHVVERVHELEMHGDVATSARGAPTHELAWVPADALTPTDLADRAALEAWRASAESAKCEWMTIGWYDRARRWIEQSIRTAGYAAPVSVRQIRTWMSSCVLRVECRDTVAYFKALPNTSPE